MNSYARIETEKRKKTNSRDQQRLAERKRARQPRMTNAGASRF
jgi:hypothetical protein